jgi:hypothetical protein
VKKVKEGQSEEQKILAAKVSRHRYRSQMQPVMVDFVAKTSDVIKKHPEIFKTLLLDAVDAVMAEPAPQLGQGNRAQGDSDEVLIIRLLFPIHDPHTSSRNGNYSNVFVFSKTLEEKIGTSQRRFSATRTISHRPALFIRSSSSTSSLVNHFHRN